jgi:hypothetical protein
MEEWKITRDRRACERPGCPLATAPHHYAVLEFPACVRRDLCEACFAELENRAETPLVYWRAPRKQTGSKDPVLDLQSLRALFDRLGTVDDERARSLRYFCALLLLRKRVLRIVPARTPEQERADLVVVDGKRPEMEPVALFAPAVDLADLGAIKEDLLAAIGEGVERAAEAGE